ncbi:ribosome biogenesis protein NSA2 [Nematocida parisii]|uniref:30S ribosomal protein S8e n=1 Tax=Nematocida parisii (strain ERTm3) TaxID=935791 RepID=I3EHB6_NEMP3|nr:30S ribosomal protein S8e [Nematocida parisii ERTm1]EIJ88613.1 30S ribosomal protein S8e [Nematocida parisii ERTm3]KAI5126656.1 ribosome biogenesis protein NSA2 [Nematocida parisii]EIJ94864.1 30S ribosomal protein S8e [Nematocida parisii ERTm1]KAI5130249.1 ribosome biogenesis protein NSA2 [Nematocida parisii]KAI5143451.1 ribosome biogenesis protein NSA2 [Nematocida parisii]|eukprot:XP_013058220.1 30S ribosomal protein S8e [Nematocida parisii ERTm1]
MSQHNYVEEAIKLAGRREDYLVRKEKYESRAGKRLSKISKELYGRKAIIFHEKRRKEKIQLKKEKMQTERKQKKVAQEEIADGAIPAYLLDREKQAAIQAITTQLKEQRQNKAGKYTVPVPQVRGVSEAEAFKVMKTGKRQKNEWKRVVTKPCFVGDNYTRKPPKFERFIRPTGLRMKSANITHPEMKSTFLLPIMGVKQNPNSHLMTTLGLLTKGTIIEVNTSAIGMVSESGRIIWGKYAQITNNPENDGCVNGILLV